MRRINHGVVAFVVLCSALVAGQEQPSFKSSIELITVPVQVSGPNGLRVDGLTIDDFRLYEDGVRQPLSYARRDHPSLSVCVVLDTSGSMRESKRFEIAMAAYREIVANISSEDEVMLLSVGKTVRELMPWSPPLRAAGTPLDIKIENNSSLNSAISDSVVEALGKITTASRRDRAIIVISDGLENASHAPISTAITTRQQSETAIYAFHTAPSPPQGVEVQALPLLVGDSGGTLIPLRKPDEVITAVKRVMDDLRDDYVLAYSPLRPLNGTYRRIKVEVTKPGLQIRSRGGYLAIHPE